MFLVDKCQILNQTFSRLQFIFLNKLEKYGHIPLHPLFITNEGGPWLQLNNSDRPRPKKYILSLKKESWTLFILQ